MIEREMKPKLIELAGKFPVVYVTGPRQSGKTTLVRDAFPDYGYLSLEDPDTLSAFKDDPRTFLARYASHAIFDEAQRAPELLSYLQGLVDASGEPGQFVLTGSQNFLLMKDVGQSLAGRVAVLTLPPLSHHELSCAGLEPSSQEEWLFRGGYPRIFDADIEPADFFPAYVQTYLQRDVRVELGIRSISDFDRFLRLCAARNGALLNVSSLASDCGIAVRTARGWLSALEASNIIYLLQPYHSNTSKRLIKSPKLYFIDTGLACNLLGFEEADELALCQEKGALFEAAVISELLKRAFARGREPRLSFWRDSNGNEVDLVIERGLKPMRAMEIKSSRTYNTKFFGVLDRIAEPELGLGTQARAVVYGGDLDLDTEHGRLVSYRDLDTVLQGP